MARGINNIDAVSVPFNGRIFGQNRNAPLALLIVGVHHTLGPRGATIERTRLLQQTIHKGGFAMVYVGNNGDIAKFLDQGVTSVRRGGLKTRGV